MLFREFPGCPLPWFAGGVGKESLHFLVGFEPFMGTPANAQVPVVFQPIAEDFRLLGIGVNQFLMFCS